MKTINGATLRKMFTNAFSLVEENKQTIDLFFNILYNIRGESNEINYIQFIW